MGSLPRLFPEFGKAFISQSFIIFVFVLQGLPCGRIRFNGRRPIVGTEPLLNCFVNNAKNVFTLWHRL